MIFPPQPQSALSPRNMSRTANEPTAKLRIKIMNKIHNIYIVTSGIFEGYEGTLTNICGATHLKNPDPRVGEWTYVLVSMSQVEFVCSVVV